jgi:hypothetical protein
MANVMTERRSFLQTYWTRGDAGRAMPPGTEGMVRKLYWVWLAAFFLKMAGSTWDISWHFKWLRDTLAPPHDINLVGDGIAIALILFHTYTGYAVDKAGLRLMQIGMATFIIAAPLDELNHRINGVDITTWSPSHFLLFLGTAIVLVGAIRGALTQLDVGWFRELTLFSFFFFFFENAVFPNGQQEYGVMSLFYWDIGQPTGEPSLYEFAARQLGHVVDRGTIAHFSLPIPSWFYPVWGILTTALIMLAANRIIGFRWTATILTTAYVAYRCVAWAVLVATGFTQSAVPYWLIGVSVAVDLALLISARLAHKSPFAAAAISAVLVTAAGYSALALQRLAWLIPPTNFAAALPTVVLLALLWWVGTTMVPAAKNVVIARLSR